MPHCSDKGCMGADQVLRGVQSTTAYKRRAQAVEFENFGQQWQTMPHGEPLQKVLFLVTLAASIGFYVLLAILLIVR